MFKPIVRSKILSRYRPHQKIDLERPRMARILLPLSLVEKNFRKPGPLEETSLCFFAVGGPISACYTPTLMNYDEISLLRERLFTLLG